MAAQRRRRGRAKTRKTQPMLSGTLRVIRPGLAQIETAEGSFVIARGGLREGMNGDEVIASLVHRGHRGELMAIVRSVTTRATSSFLGQYSVADPLGVITPLDARMAHDFFVLPNDDSPTRLDIAEGDVVAARILTYPTRSEAGVATIERRIGSPANLDLTMEALIASYGLATEFGQKALLDASEMTTDIAHALSREDRLDLRKSCTVTIDPSDARDFDDAVSASRHPDGGYEVSVHIADVTHYLHWDSAIDLEARARGSSVYLADRVIPMLPERLSNDICSLLPNEDRLCMSILLTLDSSGEIINAFPTRTVIRSRARLSYSEADSFLDGTIGVEKLPIASAADAPKVAETLKILDEIAHLREQIRTQRGSIDFDTHEARVQLDKNGKPTKITLRTKTAATTLIEEAMLMANEAVAEMLVSADRQTAFRVHERPAPDELASLVSVLSELEVLKQHERKSFIAGEPSTIQKILQRAKGSSAMYAVNALLLRAQQRAHYAPHNDGHYALGAHAYCHFTSPIRRYPDVIVHRCLKELIDGHEPKPKVLDTLPQICRNSSEQQRIADAVAHASQKIKMAELYGSRIGDIIAGIVVGVESFGLFVMDDETLVEGLLPIRELGDEWFSYNNTRFELIGESSGRRWRLGQRMVVQVLRTTPERGQIDFKLP